MIADAALSVYPLSLQVEHAILASDGPDAAALPVQKKGWLFGILVSASVIACLTLASLMTLSFPPSQAKSGGETASPAESEPKTAEAEEAGLAEPEAEVVEAAPVPAAAPAVASAA